MEKTKSLKQFYILWSTQSLSHLGSAMTSFALTLWLYDKTGSALSTAALRICTYAPYVVMSIFAGALSDKYDKKKTMLVCDALAALTTVLVFVLYKTDALSMWHLYAVNAVSGLMNTVQQPARALSENQRFAVAVRITGCHRQPAACRGHVWPGRAGCGDRC